MRVYELQWASTFQTIHLAPNRNRRLGVIASTRRQFYAYAIRFSLISQSQRPRRQSRRPPQT